MQIYKITHKESGKVYIGLDTRCRPDYYGSGVLIKAAVKKHGKENFTKEILCECSTMEELNEKEMYYIALYNSTNKDVGYNLTAGGGGIKGFKKPPESPETREKKIIAGKKRVYTKEHIDRLKSYNATRDPVSQESRDLMSKQRKGRKLSPEKLEIRRAKYPKGSNHPNYGKKHSPETKAKMREARKNQVPKYGKENPNYGSKHSDETKRKISEALKGKPKSDEIKDKISKSVKKIWEENAEIFTRRAAKGSPTLSDSLPKV